MWKLYCLPGRLFTAFDYLFPNKGQLWASQRRARSTGLHFIISTLFWSYVGIQVYAHYHPHAVTEHAQAVAEPPQSSVQTPDMSSSADSDARSESTDPKSDTMVPDHAAEKKVAAAASAPDDPAQNIIRNPRSNSDVSAAISASFASGSPERWHAEGLDGYAVAGGAAENGCKLVQVSIDQASGASIAPVKICP